ncbi:MAG TPA: hypothetical protein VFV99_33665 [Kofleriaceae bacterium]|nr:hypothetical protein [Kofleriaceae bacterium]
MRPIWIATCALAVIGAFFVVLQAAWMLKVQAEWLPYPAQVLGAALAGLVVSRAAAGSIRAAFVAGAAAVIVLALISYALPRAFTLTAVRSPHALIVVPILVIASGAACALAARVPAPPSAVWLPMSAAFVAACTIQLGGRLAHVAGLPAEPTALVAFGIAAALVAGLNIRALVRSECAREVAIGVLALMLWGTLAQVVLRSAAALTIWDVLLLVGAPLGAAIGARVRI